MAKRCALCEFSSDDPAAFKEHSTTHGMTAPAVKKTGGGIGRGKMIALGIVGLLVVLGVANSGSKKPVDEVTLAGQAPAAAASSAPKAAAPTQQQLKVGDTVKSGNWSYTVTKAEKVKTLTWSEFGNKSDAIGTWLVVSVTLRNVGDRNFPINTTDFRVEDSAAVKYDPSSSLGAFSFVSFRKLTPLGSQFPPGVDVNSAIVFDVNPSATGLRLVLKQADNRTINLD